MPLFSVDAAYCLRKSEVEPFCSSSMHEELGRWRTAAPQNREGQYLCGQSSYNVASRCCADRSAGDATAAITDVEAVLSPAYKKSHPKLYPRYVVIREPEES